ncbi:hypothetical protein Rsub_10989 [Raphidocelis subcapitata]|uniref:Importin N-terminal domain-containing protein n=1 Tax=Raphidocelis subcapitata TaxID=307507 RepID=A0A2V0PER3_9CHLO|nr:hypothetical protein Rsub_10989 [Raphidocelis subcapitata]|eukprot:GBF98326.1 hypothetical protein Rsub_10989 [Raphidocelis subcapitata]
MQDASALLAALADPLAPPERRRAAEAWAASPDPSVWAWCAAALAAAPPLPPDQQLLAAQITRHRLNALGWQLPAGQLLALRDMLLRRLGPGPGGPGGGGGAPPPAAALLSELLLCLAAAFQLLPPDAWRDPVETARGALAAPAAARFLQLLAEEAGGDLRRLQHGGPAGSTAQLEWAAAAKARLLECGGGAAAVLLQLLGSYAAAAATASAGGPAPGGAAAAAAAEAAPAAVHALNCLAAWVRLGLLHELPRDQTEALVGAALAALEAGDEQVLSAAAAAMEEVPEFCPDPLLAALQPSMLSVAAAAAAAARAGRGAQAAAWCRAFAAFAAARPAALIGQYAGGGGDGGGDGGAVAAELLRLALLPQLHRGEPVALPAIEVWASALDEEDRTGEAGSRASLLADDREGSPPAPSGAGAAAAEAACSLLQSGLAANLLRWGGAPDAMEALGAGPAAEGWAGGLPEMIWRSACRVLGAPAFLAGALELSGLEPQPPQPLSASALDACGGGGSEGQRRHAWQSELRAEHEAARASAPPVLRLVWALHMAAAAAGAADDAAAARLEREAAGEEQVAGGAGPCSPLSSPSDDMQQQGEMVMRLVMPAGQLLQAQLLAAGDAAAQKPLPEGLAAVFCCTVKGWAPHLLAASSGADDAPARLHAVLQLVLHLALAQPGPCEALGCAAARALMQSAAAAGLAQLHSYTPMLLQALQHAAGRIGGAPEAELMAAISCSLAGPRQGDGADVASAREETTKLLLQPLHAALVSTLARLRAGTPWGALAGTAVEQPLLHGMARARALLDAALLSAGADAARRGRAGAGRGGGGAGGGGREGPGWGVAAASGGDPMESGTTSAADAVEELSARAARLTTNSNAGVGAGRGTAAAAAAAAAAGGGFGAFGGAADGPPNPLQSPPPQQQQQQQQQQQPRGPLVSLLVSEIWPLAQALCLEGASGRVLHQYAKVTALLLRAAPEELLPLLPQLLAVCGACYCRPGGQALGEVMAAAIASFCRLEGSRAPLDCTPHVLQALSRIWAQPEVAALEQPGAGDARPDLAESFLRLSAALARHAPALLAARPDLAERSALAAARCAGACHRRVASCALALLAALLAAANGGAGGGGGGGGGGRGGGEEQPLAAVLAGRGAEVTAGLLSALLAPSPLPRVHKVAALLLELASLASRLDAADGPPSAGAAPAGGRARAWLAATLQALVSDGALAPGEAAVVLAEWGQLLVGGSARSYVCVRRLRRIVREFAEQHSRR